MVIHAAVVAGIAPRSTYIHDARWLPLHVELRHDTNADNIGELASTAPSEQSALPAAPEIRHEAVPNEAQQPTPAATQAPIPLDLPLDRYYTAQEVDVRAEPINEVDLIYPQLAYQRRIRGTVQLRLFINQYGSIDEITLIQSTPTGTFDEAAIAATLALQFKPAIMNGRNVRSQKTIEVVFDPYESINTP